MKNKTFYLINSSSLMLVFCASLILLTLNVSVSAQSDLRIKKTTRMDFPGMPAGMTNPQIGEPETCTVSELYNALGEKRWK